MRNRPTPLVARQVRWLLACVLASVGACGGSDPTSDDELENVTIEGVVASAHGGAPIAGAVVSTSIDSQTATTSSSGFFRLETVTTFDADTRAYTIRVTASGFGTFARSFPWGQHPRDQEFYLTPSS